MHELKLGWLSPTGEFHECSPYDHIEVARELADNMRLHCYDFKAHRAIPADDALQKAGWVYIGVSSLGIKEFRMGWVRPLTPEQIRFLEPYFDPSNEISVNKYIKYRWNEEVNLERTDCSWWES